MTYKENITAILECHFSGFKQEIIDNACNCILELEPCEYAPFTIDELKDKDMQKLLRGFKNQQVIVTDHDCSSSVTIIEPCDVPDINVGDMISRQAVLSYIERILNQGTGKKKSFEFIRKFVDSLPSVQPQPKAGHWEWVQYDSNPNIGNWHCSECRTIIPHMPEETDNTPIYKWCPMCGARMVEPQESEG